MHTNHWAFSARKPAMQRKPWLHFSVRFNSASLRVCRVIRRSMGYSGNLLRFRGRNRDRREHWGWRRSRRRGRIRYRRRSLHKRRCRRRLAWSMASYRACACIELRAAITAEPGIIGILRRTLAANFHLSVLSHILQILPDVIMHPCSILIHVTAELHYPVRIPLPPPIHNRWW